MNKTEALVKLLERCRHFENADGTKCVSPEGALHNVEQAFHNWRELEPGPLKDKALEVLGAAVLYLMVDEVENVPGQTLEKWLGEQTRPLPTVQEWADALSPFEPWGRRNRKVAE